MGPRMSALVSSCSSPPQHPACVSRCGLSNVGHSPPLLNCLSPPLHSTHKTQTPPHAMPPPQLQSSGPVWVTCIPSLCQQCPPLQEHHAQWLSLAAKPTAPKHLLSMGLLRGTLAQESVLVQKNSRERRVESHHRTSVTLGFWLSAFPASSSAELGRTNLWHDCSLFPKKPVHPAAAMW